MNFRFSFLVLMLLCAFTLLFNAKTAEAAPDQVMVGAYISDIQEINLQSHSYRMDVYVWFRWKNPAIEPWKTAEFMNAFNPAEHVRTPLYDAPQKMADGTLYMVIRQQGEFSSKFPLQRFPFDRQRVHIDIEDSLYANDALVYAPDDKVDEVSINAEVRLPGFILGAPLMEIIAYPYPTNFGDITKVEKETYSRARFSVPVKRPYMASGIKIFLPVLLVIFCTGLVFFVHPSYVEGRLSVAITALLTLVALQLTTANGLPESDYLLLTDKVYLLSYVFIIATLLQVARTSHLAQRQEYDVMKVRDRNAILSLGGLFVAGMMMIFITTF